MHYGDLTDATNLIRIVQETQPDEIYNLAAQSHVQVSFETPSTRPTPTRLGTLRLLEAMRILGLEKTTLLPGLDLGDVRPGAGGAADARPRRSTRAARTRAAKVYAYWISVNYREAYGLHASNGILFNHESPIRGETFVTRKITRAVARIALGLQDDLYLGNLGAQRDWGHARDYVGHVPHAAAGQARRLRDRHRRAALGARVRPRRRPEVGIALTWRARRR